MKQQNKYQVNVKQILYLFAFNGLLATLLGAFGAHWVKSHLSPVSFNVYQTAINYHYYYTLLLGAMAVLSHVFNNKFFKLTCYFFFAGIVLFSGSLYLLVLTHTQWIGVITPLGGLCYIIGWLTFCFGIKRCNYA